MINLMDSLESITFTGSDDAMPVELFIRLMDLAEFTDSESDVRKVKCYLSKALQSSSVIKEAKDWNTVKQQLLLKFAKSDGFDLVSCLRLQQSLVRKPEESLQLYMTRVKFFIQVMESLVPTLPNAWEKIFFVNGLAMPIEKMEQEIDFLSKEMDQLLSNIRLPDYPTIKREVSDLLEHVNPAIDSVKDEEDYSDQCEKEEIDNEDEPMEVQREKPTIEKGLKSSGNRKQYISITHQSTKDVNWDKPLTYQRVRDVDKNPNPLYVCAICVRDGKREFIEGKRGFYDHINKDHGKRMAACDFCDYSSNTVILLARHRYRTHHVVTEGFSEKKCPVENCDFVYIASPEWLAHNYNIHKGGRSVLCPHCGGSYHSNSLKQHIKHVHQSDKSTRHGCKICKKTFKSLYYLKNHLILHDNPSHFEAICHLCGKVLPNSKRLSAHVRNIHNKEKSHACPHCKKAFFRSETLKNHIRGVHQMSRDFVCPHCDRGLPNAYELKIHINNHLKKKLYHCRLCDSWYTAGHTLATHIGVRHLGFSQIEAKKKESISMARAHDAYEKIKDNETDIASVAQENQAQEELKSPTS